MYTRRDIKWSVIVRFAWSYVIFFAAWSTAIVYLHERLTEYGYNLAVPFAPLATIGVAVAFYIGFKNNQAYDRYWEARKIWGGIVNVCRSWGSHVVGYVTGDEASLPVEPEEIRKVQQTLIYRQLGWITALRFQLRLKKPFGLKPRGTSEIYQRQDDVEEIKALLEGFLPKEELEIACGRSNVAMQILHRQALELRDLRERSRLIDYFRHIAMMDLVTECYRLQGKCERIKGTPFPRQFAYFSKVFTWIFIVVLPFGLVGELNRFDHQLIWLTVPFSIVISWIFITMELVGDHSEDPFENFMNDVPMTALCRNIEIDLRQILGEKDVPDPVESENDILM